MDEEAPYENSGLKNRIFFVPDYPYFLPKATLQEMAALYRKVFVRWNEERYRTLCSTFGLNAYGRIQNFSKGMQRQAALILALAPSRIICCWTKFSTGWTRWCVSC